MAIILVADDDLQVLNILKRTLEGAGYEVVTAINGNDAIGKFQQNHVDLVITDIIMPEKDGTETILSLRKLSSEVKIIAISGGGCISPDFFLEAAEQFGANRVMKKPFDREELLIEVKKLLCEVRGSPKSGVL